MSPITPLTRPVVKRKGYIQVSTLVIIAFCSAFFPRVLMLLKFPSIVNLLHLGIVPWICLIVLSKAKIKDKQQIATTWQLLAALIIFLGVHVASALLNNAGVVNVFVNFLLLCEHFLLLLAIISLPLTPEKMIKFRAFIIFSSFTNTIFAYVQKYVFRLHLRQGLEDNIKGVFIGQGAGHVIGASVALTFGIYYLVTAKGVPLWIRFLVFILTMEHMVMSDAKQVLLVFGIAGVFFLLTKLKSLVNVIKYTTMATVFGGMFYWCMLNVPSFKAFNTWLRPEIYGPEGEATLLKSAAIRVIPTYYDSFLNFWLGLGPGHTVGRLGGWMVREYANLLMPLGATIHPASRDVWSATAASWLGNQSSMFSPFFGWAAIWGDLGWLGLITFLYIWWIVWHQVCLDDLSKFFVLTILSFGLIFTQMEEPGYMLHTVSLIGALWHENRLRKQGELPAVTEKTRPRSLKAWYRMLLMLPQQVQH